MAGRGTDRRGKGKEPKSAANELTETLAAFTLPDSLPCSEVEFPVLIVRKAGASWKAILEESNKKFQEIEEFNESKKDIVPKSPFLSTDHLRSKENAKQRHLFRKGFKKLVAESECDYIKYEVFGHLIPALEETLNKAKIWEALLRQKCFFNGVDHIVQLLWNNNPRYPERKVKDLHLFNMPWVRAHLKDNPRPYYPKSWLWPENYAATLIQKTVRQYFVQRDEEVQEMRDFWRKLEIERRVPDMATNPYLSKKFASEQSFRK